MADNEVKWSKQIAEKRYLGDGVYVHFDGYYVVLETSDGINTTNQISLEPEVVMTYQKYLKELAEAIKK